MLFQMRPDVLSKHHPASFCVIKLMHLKPIATNENLPMPNLGRKRDVPQLTLFCSCGLSSLQPFGGQKSVFCLHLGTYWLQFSFTTFPLLLEKIENANLFLTHSICLSSCFLLVKLPDVGVKRKKSCIFHHHLENLEAGGLICEQHRQAAFASKTTKVGHTDSQAVCSNSAKRHTERVTWCCALIFFCKETDAYLGQQ